MVAGTLRRSDSATERDNLDFYAELGAAKDPAQSFPAPTELPRVASRRASPLAEWIARGTVDNIAFPSSFTAINPAMREQWKRLARPTTPCARSIGATTTGRVPPCA